jgi:hypothetical protein
MVKSRLLLALALITVTAGGTLSGAGASDLTAKAFTVSPRRFVMACTRKVVPPSGPTRTTATSSD